MVRKTASFPSADISIGRVLHWAEKYDHFLYLNGNGHQTPYGSFPQKIFVGSRSAIAGHEDSFSNLKLLLERKDWTYGFFSYDLKNEIEVLSSNNPSAIQAPHLFFAIPETIIELRNDQWLISSDRNPKDIIGEIANTEIPISKQVHPIENLKSGTTRQRYIQNVNHIKQSIVEGDFYELNYCIEYQADAPYFNPVAGYERLNDISPMPFSALMKYGGTYLLSASPERFLKKEGEKIISQPIKGTIRRSFDKQEDEQLKSDLLNSEKERAENLMIVDLVRNDLAKSAQTGSVKVEELFGIYTFKRIHQMISTVTARHDPAISVTDILRHAFPMGSMTGAPKIRVMEEIEKVEDFARGLYSGSVGYFTPAGDFDFNVVIRSILYHQKTKKISFHVGSAITYDSDPEFEYNECLLKAETMFDALST